MLAVGALGSAMTLNLPAVNHVTDMPSNLTPFRQRDESAFSKFSSSLIFAQILNFTNTVESPSPWSFLTSTIPPTTTGDSVNNKNISSKSSNDTHNIQRSVDGSSWKMSEKRLRQDSMDTLEIINQKFAKVVDPVALAIGIVGNALMALVFLITPLRLRPLSHTLASLAIINLIYTLSSLLVYLTKLNVGVYEVPGVCQISTFTLTLTRCLEAWYLFLSHLNRLRAHTVSGYERRRRRVFNTKFALVLIALLVGAPLLNLFWSTETVEIAGKSYCAPMRDTISIHLTLKKIELIATVVLPILMTVGVDLMLLLKLAMHFIFKEDDDDSVYENNENNYYAPYGTDKIIKMPVQESLNDYPFIKKEQADKFPPTDDLSSSVNARTYQLKVIRAHCHESLPECNIRISVSENGKRTSVSSCPASEIKKDEFTSKSMVNSYSSAELSRRHNTFSSLAAETYSIDELEIKAEPETDRIDTHFSSTDNDILKNSSSSMTWIEKQKKDDSVARNLSQDSCVRLDSSSSIKGNKIDNKEVSETSSKRFSAVNVVLNSLKISNCARKDTVQVSFKQDSYVTKVKPRKTNYNNSLCSQNNTSLNMAHWRSYDFTSCASNITLRSQEISEDEEFPGNVSACTIATILMGVAYVVLVLPSSYKQGVKLFLDSPSARPSQEDIQEAIFFESLVKINAVYKFLMCAVMLSSFRHAILWLLTHWIPSKITRMSSICLWGSETDNNIISVV